MENRFIEENYIKELVKINIVWANIFGIIVLAVAMILFGIPFYLFWYQEYPVSNTTLSLLEWLKNISIIFLLFITGIIAHELIHGVVFAVYSENKFKSIKFGVMPASKLFTPYCHCKEVLNIRHYRIALIMPSILLGIIPAMISIIIGNIFLLFWGVVFIMAGGGDILMFVKTLKEKKDSWILDHPTEAGYYVYKQISKGNKEN